MNSKETQGKSIPKTDPLIQRKEKINPFRKPLSIYQLNRITYRGYMEELGKQREVEKVENQ